MKSFKKILLVNLIVFGLLFATEVVFAQAGSTVSLENPIGAGTDINTILGSGIKVALGVVGSISLLVFVYGGFLWLTSAGSSEKVKKGWDTIIYAVIGLFIIFSSYAILNTVLNGIVGGSGGGDDDPNAACEAVGEGFSCGSISKCAISGIGDEDLSFSIEQQRQLCEENPDVCKLNICGGGNENVCCKAK